LQWNILYSKSEQCVTRFLRYVLLLVHDHVSFQNVLWSPDLIMWSDYLSSLLFISQPHCMTWGFGLSAQMCEKIFSFWGSYNIKVGSVEEFQGQVTPETKLWQLSYLMKFDRNAKSSSFQPYKAVKSLCPMTFITLLDSLPVQDTLIVTIHLWPMYSSECWLVSVITRRTAQKSLSITPIMSWLGKMAKSIFIFLFFFFSFLLDYY